MVLLIVIIYKATIRICTSEQPKQIFKKLTKVQGVQEEKYTKTIFAGSHSYVQSK